ncbi:MAG: hypothetical protein LHW45_07995 [Candidatus Cloacimonetes bacterium]|nr:hypothetical protein [Candidatus Cloacimonadota bacterium]MDY0367550.1 hypothetical protein [Candidatus Syntrophosphaera sp.]
MKNMIKRAWDWAQSETGDMVVGGFLLLGCLGVGFWLMWLLWACGWG